MRYPGTITIPEDAFEKTLEAAARSFRHHGFRHIVFLGDHGGYVKSLKSVAERLNREWTGTRVHVADEYYRAATVEFEKSLKADGFDQDEIGTHAGLADTALTLDVDARLVRDEHLRTANGRDSGVRGDPSRATRQIGARGTALIVDRTAEAIMKATGRR
jgi:creatinine amidohydrolase/Fe(II)-dependent formamide hydrolase-like protein